MAIAIKAENLSKAYQLGEFSTGTLSQDIERMWYRLRGKEDPFLKIGETNDRTIKGESNMVWSLKELDFEIQQGDAVGIIGRNGAGKSTLLKILSRVTTPTTGSIKIKGRIASLLEVGTGFHPELTGKENIFLNGAILGMRKTEIKLKFDEIVDFSGVERYIDTPVKRYSSGMYVRLAFAVAAHLESEILIVDEVLAVGDAEFQKKCIGKMKDVSASGGRTILFVSHNMAAVKSLCTKGIVLQNGKEIFSGDQNESVTFYQNNHNTNSSFEHKGSYEEAPGNDNIRILKFIAEPLAGDILNITSGLRFALFFYNAKKDINLDVTFELTAADETVVFHRGVMVSENRDSKSGIYAVTGSVLGNILNAGIYKFRIIFGENQRYPLFISEDLIRFEILNESQGSNSSVLPGTLALQIPFAVNFQMS